MNGWTSANNDFREAVVRKESLDVLFVSETHWIDNSFITLDDYVCLYNNRSKLHRNATRGSGGVAIYIKSSILEYLKCVNYLNSFFPFQPQFI